jgi:probable rRNA maturation factor
VSGTLVLHNRVRAVVVNSRCWRLLIVTLLEELLGKDEFDLGIYFVGAPEMTRLNETFLHHAGPTDVIAFDYAEPAATPVKARTQPVGKKPAGALTSAATMLHGEIFICVDEAVVQGRRFRAAWQSELARYLIHGVLHLLGHDDQHPADRRKMKRVENRMLAELSRHFPLSKLACRHPRASRKS